MCEVPVMCLDVLSSVEPWTYTPLFSFEMGLLYSSVSLMGKL